MLDILRAHTHIYVCRHLLRAILMGYSFPDAAFDSFFLPPSQSLACLLLGLFSYSQIHATVASLVPRVEEFKVIIMINCTCKADVLYRLLITFFFVVYCQGYDAFIHPDMLLSYKHILNVNPKRGYSSVYTMYSTYCYIHTCIHVKGKSKRDRIASLSLARKLSPSLALSLCLCPSHVPFKIL